MHRTDATDFEPDIGNGERGFKETPPGNETVAAANFWNAVQEEISFVITEAGLTLRATGAADAAAQWKQLKPAIDILITNVTSVLNASDIVNDSGVSGADVAAALDALEVLVDLNTTDILNHITDPLEAHDASAIDNNSGVGGANVEAALNTLLLAVLGNTSNITSNANSIVSNAANIAVNSAALANLPVTSVGQIPGETGVVWSGGPVAANGSKYSDDFSLPGVKVGDIVFITPTNRPTGSDTSNNCSFEGIVASVNNIKINAVSHDTSVGIAQLNAIDFNITILSFS